MILDSFNEVKWKVLIRVSGEGVIINRKCSSENDLFNNSTSLDSVDEIFTICYVLVRRQFIFYITKKVSAKPIPYYGIMDSQSIWRT